jgi:nucleotide-binding universal stress UspA family protein
MRILCCLDGTNFEQISNAISSLVASDSQTLSFIYVIDTGPQQEMERRTGPLLRRPRPDAPQMERMKQAMEESAQEILVEAHAHYPEAETFYRTGQPERIVVNYAVEWNADLVVLSPRSSQSNSPLIGPKSIGHIARFIVDHAPCPVLLVRTRTKEGFPLPEKK